MVSAWELSLPVYLDCISMEKLLIEGVLVRILTDEGNGMTAQE